MRETQQLVRPKRYRRLKERQPASSRELKVIEYMEEDNKGGRRSGETAKEKFKGVTTQGIIRGGAAQCKHPRRVSIKHRRKDSCGECTV